MKEPFTWPKSSLSNSDSVIAPISTAIISFCRRLESAWISRARISFPVPFSPVIRMLASVTATFSINIRSCCMALLSPQYIGWTPADSFLAPPFFSFLTDCAAVCKVSTSFWLFQGFTMKSVAPSLIPRIASSMSAYAVKSTMGSSGRTFFISCNQNKPSLPVLIPEVKFISNNITSGISSCITVMRVTGEESVTTFEK